MSWCILEVEGKGTRKRLDDGGGKVERALRGFCECLRFVLRLERIYRIWFWGKVGAVFAERRGVWIS